MGFAALRHKFEVTGNKLRYSRQFIRREVLLPAGPAEELRKMQGIIGADQNAAVVLNATHERFRGGYRNQFSCRRSSMRENSRSWSLTRV